MPSDENVIDSCLKATIKEHMHMIFIIFRMVMVGSVYYLPNVKFFT